VYTAFMLAAALLGLVIYLVVRSKNTDTHPARERAATCPKCASTQPAGEFCIRCGESLSPLGLKRLPLPQMILGAACGAVFIAVLWLLPSYFPELRAFHKAPSTIEFAISKGEALLYAAELLVTGAGLACLFTAGRTRFNSSWRAFFMAMGWMVLGGMSLCNFFSLNSLLDRSF